jgi:hypothetical protein
MDEYIRSYLGDASRSARDVHGPCNASGGIGSDFKQDSAGGDGGLEGTDGQRAESI